MARDIVCDMLVEEGEATQLGFVSEYQGKTFFFCSKECKDQFEGDPQKFGRDKPAEIYTGPSASPMKETQLPQAGR